MDANEIVHVISPGNDLAFTAKLWQDVGGVKVPLTLADGAATVFIVADAPGSDTPADPVLVGVATWLAAERWDVKYNATDAKDAALKAVFSGTAKVPYLVVKHPGGCRAVAVLEYSDEFYFTVS